MGMTKQRETVMGVVYDCKDHPTAEKIYELAQKRLPNIGLGTVYRNLNILCDEGAVLRIHTPGDADHFDFNTMRHDHFYCTHCGQVFDIDLPPISPECFEQSVKNGATIKSYHLIVEGQCAQCSKKLSANDEMAG